MSQAPAPVLDLLQRAEAAAAAEASLAAAGSAAMGAAIMEPLAGQARALALSQGRQASSLFRYLSENRVFSPPDFQHSRPTGQLPQSLQPACPCKAWRMGLWQVVAAHCSGV